MSVTAKDLFGRPDHTNHLGGSDLVEDLTAPGLAFHQPAITQASQVTGDVGLAHTNPLHQVGHPPLALGQLEHDRKSVITDTSMRPVGHPAELARFDNRD